MKAVGRNTAISTSEMAISAPPTSSMVLCAAALGDMPWVRYRSTFSTTTIASSTTMPIASTRPNSDSVLKEMPTADITANEPISDTGIAIRGMIAARQVCRKRITTITTSSSASNSVSITASTEAWMNSVGL